MKKVIAATMAVVMAASLMGCAKPKIINGVKYGGYGLLNEEEMKNPGIKYEVVWGNVFWGVVLIETVIAPIYFFGFSLYEPVGPAPGIKGQVN